MTGTNQTITKINIYDAGGVDIVRLLTALPKVTSVTIQKGMLVQQYSYDGEFSFPNIKYIALYYTFGGACLKKVAFPQLRT
jgi:hypothetical protein